MKFEDINLCDLSQFERGCPHEIFAFLRAEAPLWFHPGNELCPDNEGFWVVSNMELGRQVLKNFDVFSSETGKGAREGGGTTLMDMSTDMAPGLVLAMMDPPKHDDIRGLVSQGFFARTLKRLDDEVHVLTGELFDRIAGKTEVDFLRDIAAELPVQVICTMAGLPRKDWHLMKDWADAAIEYAAFDPQSDTDKLVEKLTEMGTYAFCHIQELRNNEPDDTVLSRVVHATIPSEDGGTRALDDLEAIRFFNLLITGGSETTRNAIAGGYYLLLNHPEQMQLLANDPDTYLDGAIEEILRMTAPVHFNRRTASEDIELNGELIKRGDKVTVWYPSANRDETLFENPDNFDIRRKNASKHLSFGAGIHHCLGASLARMELRIVLEHIIDRFRGKQIEPAGDIKYIRSNRHQGVAEMKINVTENP